MGMHVDWADFRIPPINLWVLPRWKAIWHGTGDSPSRRQAPSNHTKLLHHRFMQLLTARGKKVEALFRDYFTDEAEPIPYYASAQKLNTEEQGMEKQIKSVQCQVMAREKNDDNQD